MFINVSVNLGFSFICWTRFCIYVSLIYHYRDQIMSFLWVKVSNGFDPNWTWGKGSWKWVKVPVFGRVFWGQINYVRLSDTQQHTAYPVPLKNSVLSNKRFFLRSLLLPVSVARFFLPVKKLTHPSESWMLDVISSQQRQHRHAQLTVEHFGGQFSSGEHSTHFLYSWFNVGCSSWSENNFLIFLRLIR